MTMRTSSRTVTFTRPFVLSAIGEQQPAGTYTVELTVTDEDGLSDSYTANVTVT